MTYVIKEIIGEGYYSVGRGFRGYIYASHFHSKVDVLSIIDTIKTSCQIIEVYNNEK